MYTLITTQGKVLVFSVLACAQLFQQAYGGTLINPTVGMGIDEKACV